MNWLALTLTRIPFLANVGDSCSFGSSSFLGFPYWYQYLPGKMDVNNACVPALNSINDVWLVGAAIIEILLRIAGIVAVVMIVYGGIQYVMSNGNPDQAQRAQHTLINAIIGLVVAVGAATIITYVAGRFNG